MQFELYNRVGSHYKGHTCKLIYREVLKIKKNNLDVPIQQCMHFGNCIILSKV